MQGSESVTWCPYRGGPRAGVGAGGVYPSVWDWSSQQMKKKEKKAVGEVGMFIKLFGSTI